MRRTKRNRQLMFHRPEPIRPNLGIATTIPPEDFEYDYDWDSYFTGSVRVPHKRGSGSDRLRVDIDIGFGASDEIETEWMSIDPYFLYDEYDDFEFDSESSIFSAVSDVWDEAELTDYEADLEYIRNDRKDIWSDWKGSDYLYVINFFNEEDAEDFQEGETYSSSDLFEDFNIDSDLQILGQRVEIEISDYDLNELQVMYAPECRDGEEGTFGGEGRGSMLLSNLEFTVVQVEGASVYFAYTGAGGYPLIDELELNCQSYNEESGWSITFSVNNKMSSGEGDNEFGIIAAVEHILAEAMELANDDDQIPYQIEFTALGQRGGGRDKVYKIFARKIAREWDYDIVSDDVSFKLTKKEI